MENSYPSSKDSELLYPSSSQKFRFNVSALYESPTKEGRAFAVCLYEFAGPHVFLDNRAGSFVKAAALEEATARRR